ncbi:MAG: beta-galactosidase [Mangrovibacterium sp.]
MKNKFIILIILLFFAFSAFSQSKIYTLDATGFKEKPIENYFRFQGESPDGITLGVNNLFWTKNDQPWIPIMGEFHYSRYLHQFWEEEILKMKSAGLNTIATYVFWNAHENPRGQWHWEDNLNLRRFIEFCKKHNMYVWLRIGPYCNAEQLHGGLPGWIDEMKGKRINDKKYLAETRKYYEQVGRRVHGMFFSEGGPIIGIQVENEYASGQAEHPDSLKQMAIDCGMKPVYFSLTANSVFRDKDFGFLPLQGSYPYRGWEKGGGGPTQDFLYANDQWIMNSAFGGKLYYNPDKYPRGLCEQGCGSQMELANRFIVDPAVVEAHLQNQLGRGMNLVGYYMFQGGTQIPGLKRPGYPESYDFQAPLSEFGEVRPSYKCLKILHHFINDFGKELATMQVVRPEKPIVNERNTDSLRYIARVKGNSGFLFLNNTQVRIPMPDKVFRMSLKLPGETIRFPRKTMTLKDGTTAILPFNLKVGESLMKYATVQPVARFWYKNTEYLYMMEIPGMESELAFDAATLKLVSTNGCKEEKEKGLIYLSVQPGSEITLVSSDKRRAAIVILSRQQAENAWRTSVNGQESFILSNTDLMFNQNSIELRQIEQNEFNFLIFPEPAKPLMQGGKVLSKNKSGIFTGYKLFVDRVDVNLSLKKTGKDEMEIVVPEQLPASLSDIFLNMDYLGNSATISYHGRLLNDNLFNGQPWIVGIKRYVSSGVAQTVLLKIQPWQYDIWGLSKELTGRIKASGPQLNNVKILPQYRTLIEW